MTSQNLTTRNDSSKRPRLAFARAFAVAGLLLDAQSVGAVVTTVRHHRQALAAAQAHQGQRLFERGQGGVGRTRCHGDQCSGEQQPRGNGRESPSSFHECHPSLVGTYLPFVGYQPTICRVPTHHF